MTCTPTKKEGQAPGPIPDAVQPIRIVRVMMLVIIEQIVNRADIVNTKRPRVLLMSDMETE